MTEPTPMRPAPIAPMTQVSINDKLPTSSPNSASTLIGLACVLGFIALAILYGYVIGY